MKKVFVSGCYDILHAGHAQFFQDARALGDHLTVCFASDQVLSLVKKRKSSMPEDNKRMLLASLRWVDEVVSSSDLDPVLDFKTHLVRIHPQILAVTEDDQNVERKRALCAECGIQLVVLPKNRSATEISTTAILLSIKERERVPLRVDFAGGWLDVPKYARPGAYIVNCTISPMVSLRDWPYELGSGLGGSAAHALLQAKCGVRVELDRGVGWQDPAVITETGLCVWRSGTRPVLDMKFNPDWLAGRMMILWTGKSHNTNELASRSRDYDLLEKAGHIARDAVRRSEIFRLAEAVLVTHEVQRGEGMAPLPPIPNALAHKYLGGGHGGYALYLFEDPAHRDTAFANEEKATLIEPYMKEPAGLL